VVDVRWPQVDRTLDVLGGAQQRLGVSGDVLLRETTGEVPALEHQCHLSVRPVHGNAHPPDRPSIDDLRLVDAGVLLGKERYHVLVVRLGR